MPSSAALIFLLLVACFFPSAAPLKFLGYNPIFGHSHSNYIGKIADALAEAGHEVILLTAVYHRHLKNATSAHARLIFAPSNLNVMEEYENLHDNHMGGQLWVQENASPFALLETATLMKRLFVQQCNVTTGSRELLEDLRRESFDAAFSEFFDFCGLGIFNQLNLTRYALTHSMTVLPAFELHGAPATPSYVPGIISSFSEKMTLTERTLNFVGLMIGNLVTHDFHKTFDEFFKDRFGNNASSCLEMASRATYYFVNSEPLIDFPRPVTHKIVDIGGIVVPTKSNPLDKYFSDLLSARLSTVLISFGTIMRAVNMPERYKETIRQLAIQMPKTTFIWKYERLEENVEQGIPNLVTVKWLPQTDLLHDPRLSAFLTHGGAGSVMEATLVGVPLVVVPVMGDQPHNGEMIRRLGNGLVIHRDELAQPERLREVIAQVLSDKSIRDRARAVARMVAEQPQSVRERLVSHFEFMAKHGPLETLDHYGRQLTFIQYYGIDVVALLGSLAISAIAITATVLYFVAKAILYVISRMSLVKVKTA